VAWIDRGEAGSEQREKGRLRPLQAEGDFVVAVTGYFHEIVVPGFPWIDAQLVVAVAGQKIPGALDVLGGEWLAVMPFDAPMQRQRQFGAVLVP
jgi:hypothetical protein